MDFGHDISGRMISAKTGCALCLPVPQAVSVFGRKTVNTVENGVFAPSIVVALKFAKALNVSVEDLFQLRD
ncbi:MAG: transcriptional regulator [Pseudomonadota bacterium]|nr:transcriptional regulator [Pseudomonadota bacterium]